MAAKSDNGKGRWFSQLLYALTLLGFLLMVFQQPAFIQIPRTEAVIALVAFAAYLMVTNMGNKLLSSINEFKRELLGEIADIKQNLPVKSNPGAYQPVKIPPKRKKPQPTGGSALAGLVVGAAIGAVVSGGTGAVIGGLIGSILFDQIERQKK